MASITQRLRQITKYHPAKAPGLPPGQRLLQTDMPRFTDAPWKSPPQMGPIHLRFSVEKEPVAELEAQAFASLPTTEMTANFHCVTTWSLKDLVWTGVKIADVFAAAGLGTHENKFVVARAADHRSGHFLWEDINAPDVMLATHLNGEVLAGQHGDRHGGPLRLVAPAHYGYKSIKHLISFDVRAQEPTKLGKEHLRGRVAQEERSPTLPNWLARRPSRWLIAPTAIIGERNLHTESHA